MSEKSVSRTLRRIAALATTALLAFGGTSAAAFAQDDPASTAPAPTETSTPAQPTVEPLQPAPPVQPGQPPSSEPEAPAPPAPAAPPGQKPSVSGVLYADKNGNGKQDTGEAILGGEVTVFGGSSEYRTKSDADGKFSFGALAPGTYHPSYKLADGWVVHETTAVGDKLTVAANAPVELAVRAERPYSEQLRATASLDRESYGHPDTATVTVTLTNTTNREISGVQAMCGRSGAPYALGGGPGWSVLTKDGVTLAAGEQRTIKITEDLPQAARTHGMVTVDCDFAPHVTWNSDGPMANDRATVTGGTGSYTMVVGVDRNADQRIDGDEGVRFVSVVLLDPKTNEQIADAWSGEDGKIQFNGVPVGEYRAVLIGPWVFADPGTATVHITEAGGFGYRFLKSAAPADLRSTVKFEKARYESHETVRLDLTVKNIGGQTAQRVRLLHSMYEVAVPDEQWGDFAWNGRGVEIPAGESRTFTVSGKIRDLKNGQLTVWGIIDFLGRPNPGESGYRGTVDVVQTHGDITGVVYTDKNRNGQVDAGETPAGTVVEFFGGAPYTSLKATTDANGRFSFPKVPSGDYYFNYTLADGWIVHTEGEYGPVRVEPGSPLQLTARADRPYREVLKATMVLDKAHYALGAEAKITIKLTNTTDRAISGIQAGCNRIGNRDQLGGRPQEPLPTGWGDLLPPGKGVTVGAGETKTFVATEKVPVGASLFRRVIVDCDFTPNASYDTDGPRGYDWATVPGGFGSVSGPLAHDRNKNHKVDPGEAIPNTRILLRTHREDGANVVDTVSDAYGNVRFESVPPGAFWAWVDGPWKFEGEYGGHVEVRAGWESKSAFFVVPGPAPTTPVPPPGDGGSGGDVDDGTEGGGTSDALAQTGASVLGLGVVAALLIAFGIGARTAGRRKSA